MRTAHPHALLVGAVALVMTVAGCGTAAGPSPSGTDATQSTAGPARMSPVPTDAAYNAADVVFAQEMLLHAKQAVEMATLARTRAADAKVKQLAAAASKDREPVVLLLTEWLEDQHQPVPTAPVKAGQRGGASGLADEQEMKTLTNVKGTPFDRLFLQMLIMNNEAAANLLKGEQWAGKAPALISISHEVTASHEVELRTARRLLGR